ncbi:hypothetical protein D3C86_1790890 [compost metagenome]
MGIDVPVEVPIVKYIMITVLLIPMYRLCGLLVQNLQEPGSVQNLAYADNAVCSQVFINMIMQTAADHFQLIDFVNSGFSVFALSPLHNHTDLPVCRVKGRRVPFLLHELLDNIKCAVAEQMQVPV